MESTPKGIVASPMDSIFGNENDAAGHKKDDNPTKKKAPPPEITKVIRGSHDFSIGTMEAVLCQGQKMAPKGASFLVPRTRAPSYTSPP